MLPSITTYYHSVRGGSESTYITAILGCSMTGPNSGGGGFGENVKIRLSVATPVSIQPKRHGKVGSTLGTERTDVERLIQKKSSIFVDRGAILQEKLPECSLIPFLSLSIPPFSFWRRVNGHNFPAMINRWDLITVVGKVDKPQVLGPSGMAGHSGACDRGC